MVRRWRGSEFFGGATALCHAGPGRMGVHGRLWKQRPSWKQTLEASRRLGLHMTVWFH